jgi:hypothetical protein
VNASLYRWPAPAKFDRVVPKAKFYEHAQVSGAVRQRFVSEVERITWAYKLADETIHLAGNASVPEIQVFVIEAKEADVSEQVLNALDTAVQFPIIFEINRGTGALRNTRMVAAHKQHTGAKPLHSAYFSTRWWAADAARVPLPAALDLAGLYVGLLSPLLPLPSLPGETISETTARIAEARKLEREIAALEHRLRVEPQLNRKVELRRQVRHWTAELTELTRSGHIEDEDDQWTS